MTKAPVKFECIAWDEEHRFLIRDIFDKRDYLEEGATARLWDSYWKTLGPETPIQVHAKWSDWVPFKGEIPGIETLELQLEKLDWGQGKRLEKGATN
jgi:hypothetical protein